MIGFESGEDFNEIECFDAFMEMVNSHPVKKKPSEIENYIDDCKAFFRSVYSVGLVDGFNIAVDAKNVTKKINDDEE